MACKQMIIIEAYKNMLRHYCEISSTRQYISNSNLVQTDFLADVYQNDSYFKYIFFLSSAFVQLLQFRYQSGVLYRLRALGISHSMDITKGLPL